MTVMGNIRKTRLKRSSKSPGSPVSLCPLNNNGGMLCSLHDMYVAYACTNMAGLTYIQAVHTSQDYIYVMCLVAIIISTLHFVPTNTVYSYFMCTYLWMSPNVHTYAQYLDIREHTPVFSLYTSIQLVHQYTARTPVYSSYTSILPVHQYAAHAIHQYTARTPVYSLYISIQPIHQYTACTSVYSLYTSIQPVHQYTTHTPVYSL